eukprot:gene14237-20209_t
MMRFSDTSEQDELEPGQEQAEQIYIRDLDTGKYVSMQEYERSRSSNAASADDNDDMGQVGGMIGNLDRGKYVSMQEYERSRSNNAASADDNEDMGQDDDSNEGSRT